MKENIEEKEEKLISTVSDATNSGFLENVPSQINSIKPEENTVVNLNLIQLVFAILVYLFLWMDLKFLF